MRSLRTAAGLLWHMKNTGAAIVVNVQIADAPKEKNETHNDPRSSKMANVENKKLRIEMAEETLLRLLDKGQLCAADLRCLDCKSKNCLWRLCLKSCAKRLATCMDNKSKVGFSGRSGVIKQRTIKMKQGAKENRDSS